MFDSQRNVTWAKEEKQNQFLLPCILKQTNFNIHSDTIYAIYSKLYLDFNEDKLLAATKKFAEQK